MVVSSSTPPLRKIRRRGKRVEVSEREQREVVRLSGIGHSLAKISELTGYSRWTVDRILKEDRGEKIVQRERKAVPPDEGQPAVFPSVPTALPEDFKEGQAVVSPSLVESAAELAIRVSSAVDEAKDMIQEMNSFKKELEDLWEHAERVSHMETTLDEVLTTFQTLKARMDSYKRRLSEIDRENAEKAVAVHSEMSLLDP